jgi:hypothetical protein
MDDSSIARRRLLQGAGMAAGGAVVSGLAMSTPVHADDGGDDAGVTGSWLLTRQDDEGGDPAVYTFVFSLAGGHVCIAHDISPAGPPATGTWRAKGKRVWATFWYGFPGDGGPGSPGVTAKVRAIGRVRRGEFSGTYLTTAYAPDGSVLGEIPGTFSGTRIAA